MWNRLISATATNGTWGESYTFDNFGNLTGKTPTVGTARGPGFGASASGVTITTATTGKASTAKFARGVRKTNPKQGGMAPQ